VSEIAHDSIVEALSYLDRIESLTSSLASSFQIYPGPESFENLRQLLGWLLLDSSFWIGLQPITRSSGELYGSRNIGSGSSREVHCYPEANDRFPAEKVIFVLISDLLEYEVIPMVPIWKDIFNLLLPEGDRGALGLPKPMQQRGSLFLRLTPF